MGCLRVFVSILMIYVFLATFLEIGYSIYEAVAFMDSPDRYFVTCLHPNAQKSNGEQSCTQFTLLTQQYRKELYFNISNDKQPEPNYSQTNPYGTPNQTCLIQSGFSYAEEKLVNRNTKICSVFFHCLSLFILLLATLREYCVYLPKCGIVKYFMSLPSANFAFLLVLDLIIVPFLCLTSINFTTQCIQMNFMLKVIKNVGFWFIFPYVVAFMAPVSFYYAFSGSSQICCCLALTSLLGFLAIIVISSIALFLNSPLAISILLVVKTFIEFLLIVVRPFREQVNKIQEKYKEQFLCIKKQNNSISQDENISSQKIEPKNPLNREKKNSLVNKLAPISKNQDKKVEKLQKFEKSLQKLM